MSSATQVNLFNVMTLSSGDYLPTQKMIDGGHNVYGGGGITDKRHNTFNVEFETLGIGRVGARCGCVFKIKPQSWVTDNALYAIQIDKQFDLDFLIHFLNFKNFNQYANTSAQPVISLKRISGVFIPKIDLMLQKEIVSTLKNVENGIIEIKNDKYGIRDTLNFVNSKEIFDDELNHQVTLVKKLRQQLLQDAVQGKLVEQNPKDEPASELLKKIKDEKEKLIADKKLKKEKELPPIKPEEIPFEIPEGWVWCRLGEITDIQRGSSPRPKGDSRYFSKVKTDFNWITISDISNYCQDSVLLETREHLTEEGSKHSRYVDVDEFIIAVSGSTTGKCCITGINGFIYDGLAVTKIIYKGLISRFLLNYMMSLYSKINDSKSGASFPNINTEYLNNLLLPLPPLSEQTRIVQKLDELMQYCNELEASIKQSESQNEKLLQQVLREALRKEPVEA